MGIAGLDDLWRAVRWFAKRRQAARVILATMADPHPSTRAALDNMGITLINHIQFAPYMDRLRCEGRPTAAELETARHAVLRHEREKEERRRREEERRRREQRRLDATVLAGFAIIVILILLLIVDQFL